MPRKDSSNQQQVGQKHGHSLSWPLISGVEGGHEKPNWPVQSDIPTGQAVRTESNSDVLRGCEPCPSVWGSLTHTHAELAPFMPNKNVSEKVVMVPPLKS